MKAQNETKSTPSLRHPVAGTRRISISAFFDLRALAGLFVVTASAFLALFATANSFGLRFDPAAAGFARTKELNRNHTTVPHAPSLTPWSVVVHYPVLIEQPAVTSDGTFAYSVGGSSNDEITDAFYRYDPIEDTWTVLPPIPEAISSAKAVYVPATNSIYVFGNFHPTVGDTVHIYNIDTQTWSTGTPMPSGRSFPNVAYYPGNGKIYVVGGFSFDQVQTEDNQTWEYDPVANTWDTSRTPIPVPMAGSATSIVGQFIYLVGAFNNGDGSTAHYRYDIVTDSWSEMAPAPVPVYEAAGAAVSTETYLMGGENFFGARTSTSIYDTLTDTWNAGPDMNAEHGRPGGTAIGNRLLVVGGFRNIFIPPDTDVVETALAEGGPTPTPTPGECPLQITQSTRQAVAPNNSTGCFTPGFHFDNSYWRAFNMQSFTGGDAYHSASISFGIEAAVSDFGGQPATVRFYTNSGAPFPGGNWRENLLTEQTLNVLPQFFNLLTIPFVATVPTGTFELVMEVFTPEGPTDFVIGSNPDPQTGPSYISAVDCEFPDPTDLETIFPPMHLVFDVNGSCDAPTPTPTPCPEQYTITEGTDPIVPGTLDTGNHFYNGDTFIPLPFTFQLYNQTFNGVYVNNNGRLDFVTINEPNGHITSCLPATPNQGPYDWTIFALWHPLRTDIGFPGCMEEFGSECGIYTSVSGSAPNRIFNIEWRAFDRDDPKAEQTAHFEVRLYENSPDKRFDIVYGTHNGVAGLGTAGVQGPSGNFTEEFCNVLAPQNVSRTYTSKGCGTPSPTPTATPTATPTTTPTVTPTGTPTATPTPSITPTPTATATVTPTTTPTTTPRPTPTPRHAPTPRPRPSPPPRP